MQEIIKNLVQKVEVTIGSAIEPGTPGDSGNSSPGSSVGILLKDGIKPNEYVSMPATIANTKPSYTTWTLVMDG